MLPTEAQEEDVKTFQMKKAERRQWHCSGVLLLNKTMFHTLLLLLILNWQTLVRLIENTNTFECKISYIKRYVSVWTKFIYKQHVKTYTIRWVYQWEILAMDFTLDIDSGYKMRLTCKMIYRFCLLEDYLILIWSLTKLFSSCCKMLLSCEIPLLSC